jgi:hypothetical protein
MPSFRRAPRNFHHGKAHGEYRRFTRRNYCSTRANYCSGGFKCRNGCFNCAVFFGGRICCAHGMFGIHAQFAHTHINIASNLCFSSRHLHSQIPIAPFNQPQLLNSSEFDALVALDISVSNCSSSIAESAIAINVHAITTRYHPTRLPLFYQFLLSLPRPSAPSLPPPTSPSPLRIILKVKTVISTWARGGGGGTGALGDENASPPQDAYGSCIKGEGQGAVIDDGLGLLLFVFVYRVFHEELTFHLQTSCSTSSHCLLLLITPPRPSYPSLCLSARMEPVLSFLFLPPSSTQLPLTSSSEALPWQPQCKPMSYRVHFVQIFRELCSCEQLLTPFNMCTLTDISALAAAGGSVEGGQPSRLIMRMAPIDVKFSPIEMSLLMQLAGLFVDVSRWHQNRHVLE